MLILLAAALLVMTLVMAAGWAFQARVANAGWADVFWTFGTGACGAAVALAPTSPLPSVPGRQMLVAAMVAVWSLRLGLYVARRVKAGPEDPRYAELRRDAGPRFQAAMLGLMLVQAPATALLCVSLILASHSPGPFLGWRDAAAIAILATSVIGEGLADAQMARFKVAHRGTAAINDVGLWGWSRHPNYFFEWLGWLAYPVLALGFGLGSLQFLLSLAAPVLMYLLLTRVSGVPPLERSMLASRGEAFEAYQARTSMFFPAPPRRIPPR